MDLKSEDLEKMALPDPNEKIADVSSDIPTPDYTATVGKSLPAGVALASKEDIISALKAVQDPELMLNVYELGLIYDITQQPNGDVSVLMTLTSPMCPIAGEMPSIAAHAVSSVPGVGKVTVRLTFDPPWTIDRLSDDVKLMMGL